MTSGSRNRLKQIASVPSITLGDFCIQRVKVTKSLGVMVDEALTWSQQINLITTKVNKGLNILRRLREFVDLNILLSLFMRPLFNFTLGPFTLRSI